MKRALVLSAGGMYGAYQAGVWKVLSQTFQPDIIVGASIGAMNAWAIAGGCTPDALIDRWMNLEPLARFRWRFPTQLLDGMVDSAALVELVKQIHVEYEPQLEIGVVATDLLRLRPVVFTGAEVTWQHLAASTAIPGIFSQHRISNRVYSDGGLLDAVPIWAAAEKGAQYILAVNVLPELPNAAIRQAAKLLRKVMRFRQ
ncbi:MAG: patatin-like phospholipase family protein, partial [Acidobacteriaceae bacterium]|nr:patatin-like phospholipase family protein [Acidobacteriaceae bacterium]